MRDIAALLDRESAEGFRPHHVVMPKAFGCRICGETDSGLKVGFLGSRIEGKRIFVYAFMTLCGTCAGSGEALRAAERMIVDRFDGEGKGPEIPGESPAPSG